jgi:hypothetical protein
MSEKNVNECQKNVNECQKNVNECQKNVREWMDEENKISHPGYSTRRWGGTFYSYVQFTLSSKYPKAIHSEIIHADRTHLSNAEVFDDLVVRECPLQCSTQFETRIPSYYVLIIVPPYLKMYVAST